MTPTIDLLGDTGLSSQDLASAYDDAEKYVEAYKKAEASAKKTGKYVGAVEGGVLGSFFGPVGTTIGGAIGGFIGNIIGGLLSGHESPQGKQLFTQQSITLGAHLTDAANLIDKGIRRELKKLGADNYHGRKVFAKAANHYLHDIRGYPTITVAKVEASDLFPDQAPTPAYKGEYFYADERSGKESPYQGPPVSEQSVGLISHAIREYVWSDNTDRKDVVANRLPAGIVAGLAVVKKMENAYKARLKKGNAIGKNVSLADRIAPQARSQLPPDSVADNGSDDGSGDASIAPIIAGGVAIGGVVYVFLRAKKRR